jgi:5-methylcytosine-specific restriction enzyme A
MLISDDINITKAEYKRALAYPDVLKERSVELLKVLHDAPNCEATSRQLAQTLGYADFPPANALVGKLGKRIANCLNICLPEREDNSPGWWKIVAQGAQRPEGFTWRLRRELIDAMVELGLVSDNERRLYPELAQLTEQLSEGKLRKVVVNSFERNAVARKLCIGHYQAECSVCNLNFQEKYGLIGKGFIHVHHLVELSTIGKEYKVDPVKDLRPVCPNCHAMLHQRSPAFSIEELRIIMKESSSLSPKII